MLLWPILVLLLLLPLHFPPHSHASSGHPAVWLLARISMLYASSRMPARGHVIGVLAPLAVHAEHGSFDVVCPERLIVTIKTILLALDWMIEIMMSSNEQEVGGRRSISPDVVAESHLPAHQSYRHDCTLQSLDSALPAQHRHHHGLLAHLLLSLCPCQGSSPHLVCRSGLAVPLRHNPEHRICLTKKLLNLAESGVFSCVS